MKESWKTINEVWNKPPNSGNIDLLMDSEDTNVNKKATSNTMNNFSLQIERRQLAK